ncbi:MAG: peptide-methionine (S)-S-oxide reductase MsrA [Planctomycetales bacterium]|nr:peptide-methionine (S)-S-oxide reductase MsrA [Planctomycetales bacterium]
MSVLSYFPFTWGTVAGLFLTCSTGWLNAQETQNKEAALSTAKEESQLEVATFGGGCFWCVEAVFENLEGVQNVVSGYAGGHVKNPDYKAVCTGRTGHAEVCQIHYDPKVVSFDELLEVFWKTHDPTTLNRQGNDIGTQYRSVIYYHTPEQQRLAEAYKQKLNKSGAFRSRIVTEISPIETFYSAEDYHQDYYRNNPEQGYCQFVVRPKVDKFKEVFADKLSEQAKQ